MNRAVSFLSASLLVGCSLAMLSNEAEAGRRRHRHCCQPAVYSGCSGYSGYSGQQFQSYYTSGGACGSNYGACGANGACGPNYGGGNVTYGNPGVTYQPAGAYQHTAAYHPAAVPACAPQAAVGTSMPTGSASGYAAPPQPSIVDAPDNPPAPGN